MTQSATARFNHAAIYVSDLDRSTAFYQQAFGVELNARGQTGERVIDGKEETIGLPGTHLLVSKGCKFGDSLPNPNFGDSLPNPFLQNQFLGQFT